MPKKNLKGIAQVTLFSLLMSLGSGAFSQELDGVYGETKKTLKEAPDSSKLNQKELRRDFIKEKEWLKVRYSNDSIQKKLQ